jgi:hypothetical protein
MQVELGHLRTLTSPFNSAPGTRTGPTSPTMKSAGAPDSGEVLAVIAQNNQRETNKLKLHLMEFYREHNPAKCADVAAMFDQYPLREIVRSLRIKYGKLPREWARMQLAAFYKRHNEAKVAEVEELINSYSMEDIAASLRGRYGTVPGLVCSLACDCVRVYFLVANLICADGWDDESDKADAGSTTKMLFDFFGIEGGDEKTETEPDDNTKQLPDSAGDGRPAVTGESSGDTLELQKKALDDFYQVLTQHSPRQPAPLISRLVFSSHRNTTRQKWESLRRSWIHTPCVQSLTRCFSSMKKCHAAGRCGYTVPKAILRMAPKTRQKIRRRPRQTRSISFLASMAC